MTNDWAELGIGLTPNELGEIDTTCIKCGGPAVLWRGGEGELKAHCIKCKQLDPQLVVDALRAAFKARQSTRDSQPKPTSKVFASKPLGPAPALPAPDILRRVPPNSAEAEMSVLGAILINNELMAEVAGLPAEAFYAERHRILYRAFADLRSTGTPIDVVTVGELLKKWDQLEMIGGYPYLAEIAGFTPAPSAIKHYAQVVTDMAYKRTVAERATELAAHAYNGVSADALAGEAQRLFTPDAGMVTSIGWETYDTALVANEEYLKRTAVVENLCYSSAVSMITGGKHAGKSTLARWMAVCVAKGWQFLDRQVTQGPVLYIASEDETMAARQELIRLGWTNNDPLRFLSAQNIPDLNDPQKFLSRLAEHIRQEGVVLVVLDMLFDFVRIADEMSYAGTRHAVGAIQDVASASKGHICAIHHAPKNAQIGDAAVAALGSQGLAARVSPIILVRRFGPGVHSISSTSVRDPRGKPILESRLVKNEDGSVVLGGGWKNYMLAEVYSDRVVELLGAEEGSEMTAAEVAESLDLSYQVAKSTLSMLYRQNLIDRDGAGKKGKPYRYSSIKTTYGTDSNPKYGTGRGDVPNPSEAETTQKLTSQGRFGYKEN